MTSDAKLSQCTNSDYLKLAKAITEFNFAHLPPNSSNNMMSVGFVLNKHPYGLIGGITGRLELGNCLSIEILWLESEHRNQDYGSKLLAAIEQEARARGSHLSQVDTFDFQALGFYEKNGYELFGILEDCPTIGHKRYYLKKKLVHY